MDGLRAIAVLAVVGSHAAKWATTLHQGVWQAVWSDGAHGVDLFFVLSGFCLSYPFLRAVRERGFAAFSVPGYIARRIVRIVPPYYCAIAVLGAGIILCADRGLGISFGDGTLHMSALDVLKQALFLDRQGIFINQSFWTLAIEWRWYFVFPLCLLLWTRSPRGFLALLIACAAAAAGTHAGGYDLLAFPAFLLGIVAADLELSGQPAARLSLMLLGLSLCLAVLLDPAYVLGYSLQQPIGWQLASFCLVLAAGNVPALRAALSIRPLVWTGVASYSIYLVHEPIIELLARNSHMGAVWAGVASVACGFGFWLACERWFVTAPLKGKLTGWLHSPATTLLGRAGIPRSFVLSRSAGGGNDKGQGAHGASTETELVQAGS